MRGWGPLASVPAAALSLPLCAAAGRSARSLVDSPVPQAAGGSLAPRGPLLRRRFPRPLGVGRFVAWVRSPCRPKGRQGERLRTIVRALFVGYRFGIRSGSLGHCVGVVAAAPRPSFVGFLSFRATARFVSFAAPCTAPRWGAHPAGGCFGAAPAPPPLMARGAPRPLLRFGWSLRSHRPTVRAASAHRCRASRGFFFGYRWGRFPVGWRSLHGGTVRPLRSPSGASLAAGLVAYGSLIPAQGKPRRVPAAHSGAGSSPLAVASLTASGLLPAPVPPFHRPPPPDARAQRTRPPASFQYFSQSLRGFPLPPRLRDCNKYKNDELCTSFSGGVPPRPPRPLGASFHYGRACAPPPP